MRYGNATPINDVIPGNSYTPLSALLSEVLFPFLFGTFFENLFSDLYLNPSIFRTSSERIDDLLLGILM